MRATTAWISFLFGALGCSSTVQPRADVTLLITNGTCETGQCAPVQILGFPSNQPHTPGDSGRWTSASSLRQQRALRSRPQRPSVSLMRQRARRRPTRGRRLKDCRWERCSRLRLAFKPRRAPVSSCQRARGGGASPCPPAPRYRLGKPVRREGRGSRVSESVISVSELTRRFGAATALDSVSVSLPRGAVYGLVGANGAGKTTLIRHVMGRLRAESGSGRRFGIAYDAERGD